MKKILTLLMAVCLAAPAAMAQTPAEADAAYRKADYPKAAALYTQLLEKTPSAALYYNLGNTHYKLKEYAAAVLCYQRALHLDPSMHVARENLQMTQLRLPDQFDEPQQLFFVGWGRALRDSLPEAGWCVAALVLLALTLACALVFWFAQSLWSRKAGFVGMLLCLACTLAANGLAAAQHYRAGHNRQAVVTNATELRRSPDASAPRLRSLHEGTTVEVADGSISQWLQVQLPDGGTGWLTARSVTRVVP